MARPKIAMVNGKKRYVVTSAWLEKEGACNEAREFFEKMYGALGVMVLEPKTAKVIANFASKMNVDNADVTHWTRWLFAAIGSTAKWSTRLLVRRVKLGHNARAERSGALEAYIRFHIVQLYRNG